MGGGAFAEGVAGAAVSKLAEYLVAPIGRQLGYLFCYNTNIEKMKSKVTELNLEMERLQQKITMAKNNCQVIEERVISWEQDVKKKKEEVEKINLEDQKEVGKGCWKNWCVILKSRYSLGKKAMKDTQVLDELVKKGNSFDAESISHPPPPLGIVSSSGQKMPQGSYVEFDSRFPITRDVMEALKDDEIHMIGIWGMAGVGKTTMVKEVYRKVKEEEHMFEEVVKVDVSQEPNLLSIQGEIAKCLGLTLEGENFLRLRAGQLRTRLAQEGKRILIILDDVWRKLDLEEVGIPCGDDFKGCKIMLTSRNKEVCDQMSIDADFQLQVLNKEEARGLFKRTVDYSSFHFDWRSIAEGIVGECSGLPLAITTIATALIKKKEATWRDVLRQLKNAALEGPHAKVYEAVRVSYDFLESEEIKKFFLLCCSFPEDYAIPVEDLVRYGVGRRLFENTNMEQARNRAYSHVEKLQNSNLLLASYDGHVKMHDLVRDVAIWIAQSVKHVKDWPRPMEDSYSDCTSISVQCDEMRELPNQLRCPNLELLRLVRGRYEVCSMEFPEGFYEGMRNLQVIDLGVMIVSLPRSLQLLTNLRTLSLDYCQLKGDVSIIGNLERLEILSFARSNIEQLPREIGNLTRLRLLDLTWCRELRTIAPGVLSNLTCLEELYMRCIAFKWAEVSASPRMDESRASFDDLKKLAKLLVLAIDIPYEVLQTSLIFENLEKFNIAVGGDTLFNDGFHNVLKNTLILRANKSVLVEGLINTLHSKIKNLHLEVKDLKHLPDKLEREGFSKLIGLKLISCEELVCIVRDQDTANVFPDLDTLHLQNLGNLEVICRGQHSKQSFSGSSSSMNQPASFRKLRTLKLSRCNKLKSIFSLSIARNLIDLKVLEIVECQMMEEIFSEERGDQGENAVDRITFTHLTRLKLETLPNLVGFCKALVEVELPQLEALNLRWLTKLNTLYPGRETLASEHHQHCLFKHKVTEIQSEQDPSDSISKLRQIQVDKCEKLLCVFPCNMTEQLQNLEYLQVKKCSSVEVVFDLQGSNIEEGREVRVLPQLKEVSLTRLPELKYILKGVLHVSQGFQNLSKLTVEGCDSLETIFSASTARGLVMLQYLNITKCQMLEAIFSNGGGEVLKIELPNLKRMHLVDLPNLVGLCNSIGEVKLPQLEYLKLQGVPKFAGGSEHHHASPEHPSFKPTVTLTDRIKMIQNLRELQVVEFDSVEVVFNLQELNSDGGCEVVALNQLTEVFLSQLPKLTHVWEEDAHITWGFQNLTSIDVQQCDSLRHLFTTSMAKILVKLKNITIIDCKLFEAIVAKEGVEEECTIGEGILFPQLTKLHLSGLPNLLSLAPKSYTFNWSSVEGLIMKDCGKGAETLDNELSEDNIAPKVRNLNGNCKRGTTVIKSEVLTQLQNLNDLNLKKLISVEVVFDLQGLNVIEGCKLAALAQLREVELSELPKLTHVWKQGPHIIQGFQNMEVLRLSECGSLRHLFTSSMAKILVGLVVLDIRDCKLLEAIVAKEEGGEEECITVTEEGILFPKLKSLFLNRLPNLLTIMPHNFNCSSLKGLYVFKCGKGAEAMNDILHEGDQQVTSSSSMGTLQVSKMGNTVFPTNVIPRLHNLHRIIVRKCSSVEVVFDFQGLDVNEGPELASLESMRLSGLPKLANMWKMGQHNIQGFQNLSSLRVYGCDNLRYLLTPSMSKCLVELKYLYITECKLLEAIVAEEVGGVEEEEEEEYCATTPTVLLFPKLFELSLHGLPNLMTITPKAYRVDWSYVTNLNVERCGKGADILNAIILHQKRVKSATEFGRRSDRKWPELVGLPAQEAERKIEEDMLGADTVVVPLHALYSVHLKSNQIEIVVDSSGKVVHPPYYNYPR